jgi:hypothetical protein
MWSPDSQKITLRIVGFGSNDDHSVPSPWECEYTLGTQQFRAVSPSNNPASMAANSLPGERYPETRTRFLKVEDIQALTDGQLRYAINEMFARRGAEFVDKDIKKIFSKLPWSRPIPGKTYEAAESEFTPIEEQNLKLLGAMRDQRAGRPTLLPSEPAAPPLPNPANWAGNWTGTLRPSSSASGRSGNFKVRLSIDDNAKAGNLFIGNEHAARLATFDTSSSQMKMRGTRQFPDGLGTFTVVILKKNPRTLDASIRTDTANGGWSVMDGMLAK